MARPKSLPIREELRKLFPTSKLRALARETGAVIRVRKVDAAELFWSVVLGFGGGSARSLAGLRRAYERASGERIEESSFFNRFNAGFAKMMRVAFQRALLSMTQPEAALRGALGAFADVMLTDSTVVRLHHLLEKSFPACRTNHTRAALKLHTIMSVKTSGMRSIKITSERRHDGPVLVVGRWVREKLLVFDLGYFSYHLFARINQNGGFFLSRIKSNCNAVIVANNRRSPGRSRLVAGLPLQEAIAGLKRGFVDVTVSVSFNRRGYDGNGGRRDHQHLRVVGVRDERSGEFHLYATNAPAEKLSAEDVRAVYACRWQIELLFKELKSHYRLEDLPSRNKHIVEALIFASLITALISRQLLAAVRKKLRRLAERTPEQRWATLFAACANDLLLIVLRARRHTLGLHSHLAGYLLHEAVDPNVDRPGLVRSIEMRRHLYMRKAA